MSPDPLFELSPGKTPYHYCHNSPLIFKDPSGLFAETTMITVVNAGVFYLSIHKANDAGSCDLSLINVDGVWVPTNAPIPTHHGDGGPGTGTNSETKSQETSNNSSNGNNSDDLAGPLVGNEQISGRYGQHSNNEFGPHTDPGTVNNGGGYPGGGSGYLLASKDNKVLVKPKLINEAIKGFAKVGTLYASSIHVYKGYEISETIEKFNRNANRSIYVYESKTGSWIKRTLTEEMSELRFAKLGGLSLVTLDVVANIITIKDKSKKDMDRLHAYINITADVVGVLVPDALPLVIGYNLLDLTGSFENFYNPTGSFQINLSGTQADHTRVILYYDNNNFIKP